MLSNDFNEKVNDSISSEKAFTFMNGIKGTPAYWEKFLFNVLAMVKQLGVPTLFMTFFTTNLRWIELMYIISKLNKQYPSENDI